MARKDMVEYNGGGPSEAVNLDFKVGAGGQNKPEDVMTAQALLRYLGLDNERRKQFLGNIVPPKSDGICGPKTLRAIRSFQQKHAHRLIMVDGVIHPASYKGRQINETSKPILTITLLHLFAVQCMFWLPDADYISGLIRIEPKLRGVLVGKIDI
ncbi:MAG: peptidoglycan-binding domain-containing protein [Pyrinomonadaceae bacterium]